MSDYQSFQIQAAPAASEQQSGPNVRVLGGVERATAGAGHQPEQPIGAHRGTAVDYSNHQTFQNGPAAANAGVLETARSEMGRQLAPSEITPQSMVTVGGVEMRAIVAERLGYLVKGSAGYQAGAQPTAQEAPQQTNSGATESDAPQLGEAATGLLEAYNGSVAAGDLVQAAHSFLDNGEVDPATIGRIASQRGTEPGQVAAEIDAIRQGFADQAAEAIGSAEYLAAAEALFPTEYKAATRAHVRGDVSGYAALASKVTNHAIRNAGSVESTDSSLSVRTVQGVHLVSGPGFPGEIDLRQAVKLGMVSVRHG